jgi:hypothetical protein
MTADCNPAGERDAVCEQTTAYWILVCTVYEHAHELQLFQLRLPPEQSEKVEYEREGCWVNR